MFELFTDRARRVVVLAHEEAQRLNDPCVDTEHLLLGICDLGESVAEQALASRGITLDEVSMRVHDVAGEGGKQTADQIPFTQPAKTALELSYDESQRFGHDYIGPEHLLLGLIREGKGVAATVLVTLGADVDSVRQHVVRIIDGYEGNAPVDSGRDRPPLWVVLGSILFFLYLAGFLVSLATR